MNNINDTKKVITYNEEHAELAKKLAVSFCKKYNLFFAYDDVLSEINLEILKLLPLYDPGKNAKFSTFLIFHLQHHKPIERRILGEQLPLIYHPEAQRKIISAFTHLEETSFAQLSIDYNVTEVDLLSLFNSTYVDSIDRPIISSDGNTVCIADTLLDDKELSPAALLEKKELYEEFAKAFESLDLTDQYVLSSRYLQDTRLTYEEIGDEVGHCRQWVPNREKAVLAMLKESLEDFEDCEYIHSL